MAVFSPTPSAAESQHGTTPASSPFLNPAQHAVTKKTRLPERAPAFVAAIEHLEDRTLLSGNVLVTLSGSGVLNIRGDSAGN